MSAYARSWKTWPSAVDSEPMQLVNVPGMVSNPPDTSDKQIEETSTPVSLVSSSFSIADETHGF